MPLFLFYRIRFLPKLNENVFALHFDLIHCYAHVRGMLDGAGFQVEGPCVQGANYLAVLDDSLSERAAAMWTHVVHCGNYAILVGKTQHP